MAEVTATPPQQRIRATDHRTLSCADQVMHQPESQMPSDSSAESDVAFAGKAAARGRP